MATQWCITKCDNWQSFNSNLRQCVSHAVYLYMILDAITHSFEVNQQVIVS